MYYDSIKISTSYISYPNNLLIDLLLSIMWEPEGNEGGNRELERNPTKMKNGSLSRKKTNISSGGTDEKKSPTLLRKRSKSVTWDDIVSGRTEQEEDGGGDDRRKDSGTTSGGGLLPRSGGDEESSSSASVTPRSTDAMEGANGTDSGSDSNRCCERRTYQQKQQQHIANTTSDKIQSRTRNRRHSSSFSSVTSSSGTDSSSRSSLSSKKRRTNNDVSSPISSTSASVAIASSKATASTSATTTPETSSSNTFPFDADRSFVPPSSTSSVTSATSDGNGKNHSNNDPFRFEPFVQDDEFKDWKVGKRYKLEKILGKGSYGEVAEAIDLENKRRKVAIKRMPDILEDETDAKRMFREIYILRRLRHPHVCHLIDIIRPAKDIWRFKDVYMVFEFLDTDLYKLIMSPQYLTTAHVQSFLYQLLCGIKFIHSAAVIHRDLKPANILLNEDCRLKICDFGLSRVVPLDKTRRSSIQTGGGGGGGPSCDAVVSTSPRQKTIPNSPMAESPTHKDGAATTDTSSATPLPVPSLRRSLTKHVVTRWYRAPELILLQDYDSAVDMWSIGCIFAELLSMQAENVADYHKRRALFPGKSCFPLTAEKSTYSDDRDQLNLIMSVIGTPSEDDMGEFKTVSEYLRKLEPKKPRDFTTMWPKCNRQAIDLLKQMLVFNPKKRITVADALNHPYLKGTRRLKYETLAEPIDFPKLKRKISTVELKRIVHREIWDFCDEADKRHEERKRRREERRRKRLEASNLVAVTAAKELLAHHQSTNQRG